MNALTISNELIKLGMDKGQSDFIAKVVDKRNNELATKSDLKIGFTIIKIGFTLMIGVMSASFGYLLSAINNNHDLLNTLISKLN